MPSARANQNMHPSQSWGPPPMSSGGHGYGSDHSYMAPPPPSQYDDYYPPSDMPFDNQPHSGPPTYSKGAHATNVQPQQSMIGKVDLLNPIF